MFQEGDFVTDNRLNKVCRIKKISRNKICTVQYAERVMGSRTKITELSNLSLLPVEEAERISRDWNYDEETD